MPSRYPRFQPRTAKVLPGVVPLDAVLKPPAPPPPVPALPVVDPVIVPVLIMPKERELKWTPKRLFDGVPLRASWGRFDCFVAATIARAAYSDDEEIHNSLQSFLGSDPWVKVTGTQSGIPCSWYEYPTPFGKLISIPGTTDFSQWVTYLQPFMLADRIHADLTLYAGLKPYIDANTLFFESHYAGDLAASGKRFAFVGHSLGGILAYALQLEERVGTSDQDAYTRTLSCYTFGAPAAYLDLTSSSYMYRNLRTIRTVNPGDPVPDLVQQAIRRVANLAALAGLVVGQPPIHYASFSWMLDGTNPRRKTFWDALDALRNGAISAISDQFRPHKISSYCDALELECLKNGDAPWPDYTYIVSINRQLSQAGR